MYNKSLKKLSVSTFAIKVFFLIVIFFGFPYLLVTFLNRYQSESLGIIEQQNTIVEIQSDKNDESRYNDRKEYMRKQKEQDEERRSKKINPKYSQQLFGSFYGDYVRQIERMTRDVIESESDSVEV